MFLKLGLVLLIIAILFLLRKDMRIRKEMIEILEVLEDIKKQDSKQKFLIQSRDNISKMKTLLNEIFYKYDNIIEDLTTTAYANQQLMTSLSHDIRTPMTTLMGYLDAVSMQLIDEDQQEKYIEMAKEKAYDIKEYMDVLFEWFRLNSNEEILQIENLDIAEKSRQILTDWIPILEEKGINFEIEIPEDTITVQIDFSCYTRIINNIMQNILAHSQADYVYIKANEGKGAFRIKIKDNGIGISQEDIKYIFERLYKCDESRHNKGNGLGLNIVKILTERMNGTVGVASEIGKGTEFTLTFPLRE